jgi:hypothetical protein
MIKTTKWYVAGAACRGNHVNDRIIDNFLQNNINYGFYVNDGGNGITGGHFENNYIQGGTVAIYMTNAAGWYIDNNHSCGQYGNAFDLQHLWGTLVSGNYIEEYTGYGISGTVGSGAVIGTSNASGSVGLDYDGNGKTFTVASTGNLVAGVAQSEQAINGATATAGV